MISQSEGCGGATCWNLKLIDDLLPKLVVADSLTASSAYDRFVKFAQIQLFASK